MSRKFPSPSSCAPACFGDRYLASDPTCRTCPAREPCADSTAAFAETHSLTERLAEFQLALTDERPESFTSTYARVYRETFGRPCRMSRRHAALFDRCVELCQKNAIDPATYIAGNMWAMRKWVESNPRIGFQPTHLSGENAWRRYHAYTRHLDRTLRHAKHNPLAGRTDAAKARLAVFVGELRVAEEFVAHFLSRNGAAWPDAIAEADPNVTWRSAQSYSTGGGSDDEFHRLSRLFGSKLARECEFATLRAAAYLAESYQRGLADRIGYSQFDWHSFARLVRRLVNVKPARVSELADVEGVTWP